MEEKYMPKIKIRLCRNCLSIRGRYGSASVEMFVNRADSLFITRKYKHKASGPYAEALGLLYEYSDCFLCKQVLEHQIKECDK